MITNNISRNVDKYFGYAHLPVFLQEISKPFHDMAVVIAGMETVENSNETEYSLRMLLCSKDSAVRASVAFK